MIPSAAGAVREIVLNAKKLEDSIQARRESHLLLSQLKLAKAIRTASYKLFTCRSTLRKTCYLGEETCYFVVLELVNKSSFTFCGSFWSLGITIKAETSDKVASCQEQRLPDSFGPGDVWMARFQLAEGFQTLESLPLNVFSSILFSCTRMSEPILVKSSLTEESLTSIDAMNIVSCTMSGPHPFKSEWDITVENLAPSFHLHNGEKVKRRSTPRSLIQLTFPIEFLNVFKAKPFLAELREVISERASSDEITATASLFQRQLEFKIVLLEDSAFELHAFTEENPSYLHRVKKDLQTLQAEFLRTRDSAYVLVPRSILSRAENFREELAYLSGCCEEKEVQLRQCYLEARNLVSAKLP